MNRVSAKRAKKQRLFSNQKPNNLPLKYIFALVFISVLLAGQYLLLKNKLWSKDNRLAIVIPQKSNVLLVSLDPVKREMTKILIPNDLEVEVAGNLGKRKIGNVWELGIQEKNSGLLAKTLTTYLKTPVVGWSDSAGISLIEGKVISIANAVLKPYKTNLNFKDRLAVATFVISLDNIDRSTLDLRESGVVKKSVLSDGSDGYVLSGFNSSKLNSFFIDYFFINDSPKISIATTPALKGKGTQIGQILEIMGGKIVSLEEEEANADFVCEVSPKTDKRAIRISAIFDCELTTKVINESGEIQIKLGNKFVL